MRISSRIPAMLSANHMVDFAWQDRIGFEQAILAAVEGASLGQT
jgi:hypothetical protein